MLAGRRVGYVAAVKLMLENLPSSLVPQRETLESWFVRVTGRETARVGSDG